MEKRFMRPLDVNYLCGDYSKAKKKLGWKPKTKFKQLVKIMVKEDLNRWERWLNGEKFPWDAPNYPSEYRILTRALRA
jgi:GDPmannose 4,6-dehydratase